ncbi:HlyD family secretion protein [Flammeovirga sp. EKP202]|uniref:HlyD family secretion protein n=1 Tax=Flammeovirga sp. EKP202 TaxID=2770592 RepID=UPI00165F04B5|nr:HlyD family efflux transporter periplasmic adaptor subunit [Flammeovirga sp. EKP202]MBD0404784.1 HlyD family efflux transporter periplasmic adaptor subunit [Flammeovirga sp. EKP202]
MLLPPELIKVLLPKYYTQLNKKSSVLYITILIFVISVLCSLPLIKVPITVQSLGLIRPTLEKFELKSPLTEKVSKVFITDNSEVEKGEIILTLDTTELSLKRAFSIKHFDILNDQYLDLLDLCKVTKKVNALSEVKFLRTRNYLKKYEEFYNDIFLLQEEIDLAQKQLHRKTALFRSKAIPEKEVEDAEIVLRRAQTSLTLRWKRAHSEWAIELDDHKIKLENLNAEILQLNKQISKHYIRSTVSGVLQNFNGIHEGTIVFSNQSIGEITPKSDLIAECYISPKDIGWLKEEMKAIMQIDAYNYNDWGTLEGQIMEVYHDVVMIDQQPVFKVKCKIQQDYLTLSNGYKGYLKKGMTLQARFVVTKRSLFDLIYDQTDDWLNPSRNQLHSVAKK